MSLLVGACRDEALTRPQASELLQKEAEYHSPLVVVSLRLDVWIPDEAIEGKASRRRALDLLTELTSQGLLEVRQMRRSTLYDHAGTEFWFEAVPNADVTPAPDQPLAAQVILTRSSLGAVTGIIQAGNDATAAVIRRHRPTPAFMAIAEAFGTLKTGGDLRSDPWAMSYLFPRGFPRTDPAEVDLRTMVWVSFAKFDDGWRVTKIREASSLPQAQLVRPRSTGDESILSADELAERQPESFETLKNAASLAIKGSR